MYRPTILSVVFILLFQLFRLNVSAQSDSLIVAADSSPACRLLEPADNEQADKELVGNGLDNSELFVNEPVVANPYKFRPTQLIVPGALITVGVIGLESDWLKFQNSEMRDELQENGHDKFGVDDIMQYAPMVSAYGLELCGVKGLHGYVDKTIILATATILMAGTVKGVKALTKVERPDGSRNNSFPSGHTATAFMGAEFLRREYWHVSPWIGVAGYAVASGTAFLRMYNTSIGLPTSWPAPAWAS